MKKNKDLKNENDSEKMSEKCFNFIILSLIISIKFN